MAQQETSTSTGGVPEDKDYDRTKRTDYFSWEDYYMSVAYLAAQRSKDKEFQVGACIVNDKKKIIGIGYNGMPTGIKDGELSWSKKSATDDKLETKHPYVCHAELNAIVLNKFPETANCTMYVTLHPCNTCAQCIIQSGITKVFYGCFPESKAKKDEFKAAPIMFKKAGVTCKQFVTTRSPFLIDFDRLRSGKKLAPDETSAPVRTEPSAADGANATGDS